MFPVRSSPTATALSFLDIFPGWAESHNCWLLGKHGLGAPSAGRFCTQMAFTWFLERATGAWTGRQEDSALTFSSQIRARAQCINSPVTTVCQALSWAQGVGSSRSSCGKQFGKEGRKREERRAGGSYTEDLEGG